MALWQWSLIVKGNMPDMNIDALDGLLAYNFRIQ